LASISPNRVISTVRLTEVLSLATNALALEAAHRRRANSELAAVNLAASHRQVRAQAFGPGLSWHFRLFVVVSSARDTGSGRTEAQLLIEHLRHGQRVLGDLVSASAEPQVRYTVFDYPS
jgi:hypothetical protein